MALKAELIGQLPVSNVLGECVIWDHRTHTLWWTDILSNRIYCWPFDGEISSYKTPERLCSFGFTTDSDWLICAFETGFALYQPKTSKLIWISKVEGDLPANRLNDGRVDRQGRFWSGSMRQHGNGELGSLYKLENNNVSKVTSGITISNSLCWSPDSKTMYFADSSTHQVTSAEFNQETGLPQTFSPFVSLEPGSEPDGSCIDQDGFLWNAQWGGSRVVRYNKSGQAVFEVDVPCPHPTCCAFGGKDMNILFLTTAKVDLDPTQRAKFPAAGNIFMYKTPYYGIKEPIYAGELNIAAYSAKDN